MIKVIKWVLMTLDEMGNAGGFFFVLNFTRRSEPSLHVWEQGFKLAGQSGHVAHRQIIRYESQCCAEDLTPSFMELMCEGQRHWSVSCFSAVPLWGGRVNRINWRTVITHTSLSAGTCLNRHLKSECFEWINTQQICCGTHLLYIRFRLLLWGGDDK